MTASKFPSLSAAHQEAVNRRRRVVVQYDPNLEIGTDLTQRSGTNSDDAVGTQVKMVGHSELTGQSVPCKSMQAAGPPSEKALEVQKRITEMTE